MESKDLYRKIEKILSDLHTELFTDAYYTMKIVELVEQELDKAREDQFTREQLLELAEFFRIVENNYGLEGEEYELRDRVSELLRQ